MIVKSLMVGIPPLVNSGDVGLCAGGLGDLSNLGESVRSSLGDSLTARSAFLNALIFSLI